MPESVDPTPEPLPELPLPPPPDPAVVLEKMRREWDERARENARYYVATANENWTDEEYFESGRINVSR